MSDDFGTVNYRRGDRAREIEVLREHYRKHREMLQKLIADAPTEHLAAEYQQLVQDIDGSLMKLDEVEGRPAGGPVEPSATQRMRTTAADRPLIPTIIPPTPSVPAEPGKQPGTYANPLDPTAREEGSYAASPSSNGGGSRVLLIVVAGVVVLALIAFLIWRGSERHAASSIVEGTTSTVSTTQSNVPMNETTAAATETRTTSEAAAPAATEGTLAVSPATAEFGTIRKGTRAVRQVQVVNSSSAVTGIKVARSQCKCLFYEYVENLKPKGKETITVTVDGARAKSGPLRETVVVTSKKNPSVTASFDVTANIQ